jgi:hypothetical protein
MILGGASQGYPTTPTFIKPTFVKPTFVKPAVIKIRFILEQSADH